MLELSDTKESLDKQKQLNDSLVSTLEQNTLNLQHLDQVNLVLDGEFTSQKITELEREVDRHRNGVNNSVDRRVKEIIRGYHEMEQKDRDSSNGDAAKDHNNVSINYNIHKAKSEPCSTCLYLKEALSHKEEVLAETNEELDEQRADTGILSSKLGKVEALVDTLKQENRLL